MEKKCLSVIFATIRLAIWSAMCVGFVVLIAGGLLMLNCSYKPKPLVRNSEVRL